ncbi:chemokine-like factor [Rhynchonycteris naso]
MPTVRRMLRPFRFTLKGWVKMLRLVLTVTSLIFFLVSEAPEPYIVITGFEATITFFFVILYMLKVDQLSPCIFWPLLDIINSMVTTIFMIIISVLAVIPETTTLRVLGGVFGLLLVVFSIADGALVYRKLLLNSSDPYQENAVQDNK